MAWHATALNPGKCSSTYGREGLFPSPANPQSYVYRSKRPDPQPSRLGASVVPKNPTHTAPATVTAFDFSSGHPQALLALLCTSSLSTGPNLPATPGHACTNPLTSTVEPQSRFPPLAPSPTAEAHREHGCLPRTPVPRGPCLVRVSLHLVCNVHRRFAPFARCIPVCHTPPAPLRGLTTPQPRVHALLPQPAVCSYVYACTSSAAIRSPTPGAEPLVRRTRIACPHSEARAEAQSNLVRLRRSFPPGFLFRRAAGSAAWILAVAPVPHRTLRGERPTVSDEHSALAGKTGMHGECGRLVPEGRSRCPSCAFLLACSVHLAGLASRYVQIACAVHVGASVAASTPLRVFFSPLGWPAAMTEAGTEVSGVGGRVL